MRRSMKTTRWDSELFVLRADTREALIPTIVRWRERLEATSTALVDLAHECNGSLEPDGVRLALVAESTTDLDSKLAHALEKLADPACRRIRDRSGVFYFAEPLAEVGKLAFLFPGEGAQYVNMMADLCLAFPVVREAFERIDRVFASHERQYLPSQIIFPPAVPALEKQAAEMLWKMDCGTEAVSAANQALFELLRVLGIEPDAVAGHSTGEYSALHAAGALDFENEERLTEAILSLNRVYETLAAENRIPEGRLMAVGALSREDLEAAIDEANGDVFIAMDNCPHQVLLFGTEDVITGASRKLRDRGGILNELPFNRAYHTPLFEPFVEALREVYDSMPFKAPVTLLYSCATAGLFPDDVNAVRLLAMTQWARPVRFRETIEAMYNDGVRLFVEVGPRGNLTNFVRDILRGKSCLTVASNTERRSGIAQLHFMLAQLAAHGVPMRLEALYAGRVSRRAGNSDAHAGRNLSLVLPALELDPENVREMTASFGGIQPTHPSGQNRTGAGPASVDGLPPAMQEYFHTMENFIRIQEDVMYAYLGGSHTSGDAVPSRSYVAPPSPPAAPPKDRPVEPALQPASRPEQDTAELLLGIVSERTGYPVEMLDITLNLEADLGIDSIKRVEILGALQKATGLFAVDDMERVARLKTLQEIIAFIDSHVEETGALDEADAQIAEKSSERQNEGPEPALDPNKFSLLGEIVRHVPGEALICVRRLSLEHDLFLQDHTIGGRVSESDPKLTALPVMPLTMTMEMIAQAGQYLAPELTVVGLRNVSAYSWIALEKKLFPLVIQATTRKGDGGTLLVQVGIFEGKTPEVTNKIFEGTVVMAKEREPAGEAPSYSGGSFLPSTWTHDRLYTEGMFNGPRFRAVESMDRVGERYAEATLRALPAEAFFDTGDASFVSQPILLDAAGQVVGFWTAEVLDRGFVIFPFRFKSVQYFGAPFEAGEQVQCRVRITLLDDERIASDIELVDAKGRLRIKLNDWTDRRFDLSRPASLFVLSPGSHMLSESWPVEGEVAGSVTRRWLDTAAPSFSDLDASIWQKVLAHVILSRSERAEWAMQYGKPASLKDWLLERLAVKDAVRSRMEEKGMHAILPADIEVNLDVGTAVVLGPQTHGFRISVEREGSRISTTAED